MDYKKVVPFFIMTKFKNGLDLQVFMTSIIHISDLHCNKSRYGKTGFQPEKLKLCIIEINKIKPDVVVVTGDLTMFGFEDEFKNAKTYLSKIKTELLVIPGNHDSRLCGYDYYDKYFGYGNTSLELPGISLIGIDTTIPDLDEGSVGRGKLRWLVNEIKKMPSDNFKIVAMHHHLIPVPHTGRERSTISDGGTVMEALIRAGVDLVLCGHKHTPYSWLINNLAVINAGSVSATKLRAKIKNSYNIIEIKNDLIEIFLKEFGKKQKLMVRYRKLETNMGLKLDYLQY